jgi:transcriptional/translational regulatory protein YebC/TACO1
MTRRQTTPRSRPRGHCTPTTSLCTQSVRRPPQSHQAREDLHIPKVYGPDPDHNPQLANAIAVAKKASVPKDKIEAAIARAEGKSANGAALESLTFEAIVPPNIAIIVEVETDNKLGVRTVINKTIRKSWGSVSPSKFYFKRTGRVVFEKSESGLDIDQIMDDAIEAGAEDLENDVDGNIVVWTQPTGTVQVCRELESKFGLKILTSSIIWAPNEDTRARLDSSDEVVWFTQLLWALKARPDVQAVYSNVTRGTMSDAEWASIEEHLDM